MRGPDVMQNALPTQGLSSSYTPSVLRAQRYGLILPI